MNAVISRYILKLTFLILFGALIMRLVTTVMFSHRQQKRNMVELTEKMSGGTNLLPIISGLTKKPNFAPFEPNNPKKLVVITYQRCGSSFFGQLFNMNPNVFYVFEPLDSLYSAMYGVREGWNVPSDITTYWNGTERVISEKERSAVSAFLEHLLSCHVTALPTETLIHRFWFLFSYFHESLVDFRNCLETNKLKYTQCASYTPGVCGGSFGQFSDDHAVQCNRMLWNPELRQGGGDVMAQNITLYRTCMDDLRVAVDEKCSDLFKNNCEKAELRTTKTVRATMHSMGHLLEHDHNMRVIHLIRDPRAVVLSRRNFDRSAQSHYAGGSMIKEADVYCRDVVRDVKKRRELEMIYPGRIMTIIYDDLAKKPIEYAEEIYKFLNTTMHARTSTWLIRNTSKTKNSSVIANKWQKNMNYELSVQIMSQCKDFFAEVEFEFS